MAYLSYYRPLLRELGQGHVFLWGSRATWGNGHFYHGTLRDLWGRKLNHGFGDTDIHETQSSITITSDMPGVKKEEIRVSCCGDILSVFTERSLLRSWWTTFSGSMERGYGSMSRSIRLPPHTDYSKIDAKYENGVLSISITKPDFEQRRGYGDCHSHSLHCLFHHRQTSGLWERPCLQRRRSAYWPTTSTTSEIRLLESLAESTMTTC